MKTLITSIMCVLTITVNAQSYITLTGKIIDSKTQRAISYAHVGIPQWAIGTISADDGQFTLKVPNKAKNSQLRISYLGYTSFETSVANFKKGQVIKLVESPTTLTEIIVTDESRVEDIIRRAVRKIPDNYPKTATTNTGFYRESRTDSEENYIYLAEGVLKTYKYPYTNSKEGHVQIVQGRQVVLVPDSVLSRSGFFTSGHMSGLRFDFVQNREDFINEKFFDAYKYWIEGITSYNDRPVYIIGFDQEGDSRRGRMKGKVFIDTTSFAFLRAEFEISKQGLRKSNDYPLYSGNWKGNSYIVNYRQQGDRWILGDATREGLYHDGGFYINEYLVTEAPPKKGKPIPYLERVGRESAFRDITGTYDKDFWKEHNTSPLSTALKETVIQKENDRKAAEVFDAANMERLQLLRDSIQVVEDKALEQEMRAVIVDKKRKRTLGNFQMLTSMGGGVHMINTPQANISMTYFIDEDKLNSINVNETISESNFEYITRLQTDFLFKNKWAFSWGFNFEYLDNIYKNVSLGLSYQANLSSARPLFLRLGLHHDRTDYVVKIGQATNSFGEFKYKKKKFKSEKINMYYGTRVRSVMGTVGLSLELNPETELFTQVAYRIPYSEKARAWLWERKRFFLARKKVEFKDLEQFEITRNDTQFDGLLSEFQDWQFVIGIVKKTNFR